MSNTFGALGLLLALLTVQSARAETLVADRLGVIYNTDSPASVRTAAYYAVRRGVPAVNLVGISVPDVAVIDRSQLTALRSEILDRLPERVQSLLLVWSKPYAVGCMSITTAVAAGYRASFCEPGCAATEVNPLFDSDGWLPADTVGWLPAMLLPSQDERAARNLIDRGIRADGTAPSGTIYLVRTADPARNVRAPGYAAVRARLGGRVQIRELTVPVNAPPKDVIAYFTGEIRVAELARLVFLPGAMADHLTSSGGILDGTAQMTAEEWLNQGATASYGTVSEPCNHVGKFPNPAVALAHYLRGETLLEAYWKSVAMPGQGLFIGDPLARPYAASR